MRRALRWLFNLAAAVSLLACLAIPVAWVATCWQQHGLAIRPPGLSVSLEGYRGRVRVGGATEPRRPLRPRQHREIESREWHWLRFKLRQAREHVSGTSYLSLEMPWGYPLLAAALLLVAKLIHWGGRGCGANGRAAPPRAATTRGGAAARARNAERSGQSGVPLSWAA